MLKCDSSSNSLTESYPMQPYNWSDVSATFTERTLYALKDKSISESKGIILRSLEVDEIKMIIAVYGAGCRRQFQSLYTGDYHSRTANYRTGSEHHVPKDKIKMRSFEATFTADARL